jgi:hypothetical protein
MSRQLLTVVIVAVLAGSAFGFALAEASNPPSAEAAATNAQIVTELKKVNAKLATLNRQTGTTQTAEGSVRGLLTIICDYTASISCKP